MQYLFQVSIGPVQNFISAARRTRDLKFGSELLSELSKAAAKTIAINPDNILIFPTPPNPEALNPNSNFNAANKIVALISGSPTDKVGGIYKEFVGNDKKDLAGVVYAAIQTRLQEFRKDAKGFSKLLDAERGIADAQLEDLVEFFWVALPYSGDYNAVREKVEALMAARKNTRNFSPVTWGSDQNKSSIDGQLESVIPKDLYPHSWQNSAVQHSKARDLFRDFRAKPGEHLSGVDLLKRNGPLKGDNFPSTSHFATIPFLQRLETLDEEAKDPIKKAWEAYIKEIGIVADRPPEEMPKGSAQHSIISKYEGSMLFEERFSDLIDFREDLKKCKSAKEMLSDFFKQVNKQFPNTSPKVQPGTYYAILLADGDSMGKVIDHEAQKGPNRHQELSRKLAEFSESVRAIVENKRNQGSLIYAGGDDVLAFMPLHTVLQCAQELSKAFYASLQNFKTKDGNSPTLSVGVAIIHHLQPLREALNLARYAEKAAKHVDGKNALAITISKRSGSDFTIQGHWFEWKQEASQSYESFAKHLNELIDFCRQESIPQGTAYELRDMALRLEIQADNSGDEAHKARTEQTKKEMQTVIKTEAKRILERKLTHHRLNNPDGDKEETMKRHKRVAELLDQTHDVIDFAYELITAQFFADAMEIAQPTKGTQQ